VADRQLLSITITSYTVDRLNDIFELLQSIQEQTYTNIEVIFVTERSKELHEIVKSYARENAKTPMKVVFNDEPGLSAARNLGIKHASGDIIGFVDDDVVLSPDWAEAMVKTYDDNSIIGVTGPAFPLWENKSMSWFPEEFYWVISCTAWFDDDKKIKEVRNAWGHSMSFRKEAFEFCLFADTFGRTEGAHKSGKRGPVGDDTEFSMNLRSKTGKAIVYNPRVRVRHKVYKYRLTPTFIRRQAYWQGYTKAMFKKLYRNKGVTGRDVLSTEYRLLQRILVGLLSNILKDFSQHPEIAWRKFSLIFNVLFHLALGYFSADFPRLARFTERAYR